MSIFDSITNYAVSGKGADEGYRHVREVAVEVFNEFLNKDERLDAFSVKCREGEDEFMEANYLKDPNAKHTAGKRKGEWKYRTYLPGSYNTAKSALNNALEAGVDPAGVGKTALEKATRKVTQVQRTPWQLAEEAAALLLKRLDKLDPSNAGVIAAKVQAELISKNYL